MKSTSTNPALSPRGSKLLVELVIGIIGLLGIMLAQAIEPNFSTAMQKMHAKSEMITLEMSEQAPRVDWLALFF